MGNEAEESEAKTSQPHVEANFEEHIMNRLVQQLAASVRVVQNNLGKNFGIERSNVLGETIFGGTTDAADAENLDGTDRKVL